MNDRRQKKAKSDQIISTSSLIGISGNLFIMFLMLSLNSCDFNVKKEDGMKPVFMHKMYQRAPMLPSDNDPSFLFQSSIPCWAIIGPLLARCWRPWAAWAALVAKVGARVGSLACWAPWVAATRGTRRESALCRLAPGLPGSDMSLGWRGQHWLGTNDGVARI